MDVRQLYWDRIDISKCVFITSCKNRIITQLMLIKLSLKTVRLHGTNIWTRNTNVADCIGLFMNQC